MDEFPLSFSSDILSPHSSNVFDIVLFVFLLILWFVMCRIPRLRGSLTSVPGDLEPIIRSAVEELLLLTPIGQYNTHTHTHTQNVGHTHTSSVSYVIQSDKLPGHLSEVPPTKRRDEGGCEHKATAQREEGRGGWDKDTKEGREEELKSYREDGREKRIWKSSRVERKTDKDEWSGKEMRGPERWKDNIRKKRRGVHSVQKKTEDLIRELENECKHTESEQVNK